MNAVARESYEHNRATRCVLGAELEMLRAALLHWRFILSSRIGGGVETDEAVRVHRELLSRHRVALAAAATGTEVTGR